MNRIFAPSPLVAGAVLRILLLAIVAALWCLAYTIGAYPQEILSPPTTDDSVWIRETWDILQPVVTLLVGTIAPVLATWIAYQLSRLISVNDENRRKDLENKLRDAIHKSAENALKAALVKLNLPMPTKAEEIKPDLEAIVAEAKEYVLTRNGGDMERIGMPEGALRDIILSKIPNNPSPEAVLVVPTVDSASRPVPS